MTERNQTGSTELRLPAKSKTYHLMIFGGALLVLSLGGVWRGGGDSEQSPESSEVTAIEALKKEVSGVQSALSRNELEVIRDTMRQIPRDIAPSVVAVKPRAENQQPFRDVSVYGSASPTTTNLQVPARPNEVSGLVIDREGHVLTSASVLEFRFPVQVIFGSTTSGVKNADLISADAARHVALLKLQDFAPEELVPAGFEKAAQLQAGEWLVREGRTPTGEEARSLHLLESFNAATSGERVGILNDEGTPYMDGAVLVNVSGRIAGIYVHPPASDGFIVPMQNALEIATRLKANPKIEIRGWAGMELQELSEDLKEYFGAANGVLVSSVEPEGPAARAGIRAMDLVEQINDTPVNSAAGVLDVIGQSAPGTDLTIAIKRNSRPQKVKLQVSQVPGTEALVPPDEASIVVRFAAGSDDSEGIELQSISPKSAANRLGVKSGDVILTVNGRSVRSADQFWSLQRNISGGKPQLWNIQRAGKRFFVAIKERVIRP
jgi:serine protease Do